MWVVDVKFASSCLGWWWWWVHSVNGKMELSTWVL